MENEEQTDDTQIIPEPELDNSEDNSDEGNESVPTMDDYEKLRKENETLKYQKEHWRTKAQKPPLQAEGISKEWQEKLELKLDGYSEEEITFIQKSGGKKELENPYIKSAIESIRTQATAEKAVSGESASKSDIEKKFTEAQLRSMPLEELETTLRSSK